MLILTIKTRLMYIYLFIRVRRRLPSVGWRRHWLIIREIRNISKYVHLSVKTDFTQKITKFANFKIFDA